jgi:carbon storage regulator
MLVLSRKAGEKIVINGNIEVSIVSVDRGKVRLGISAPPDVSVHRKEVFDRIAEFAEPHATVTSASEVAHHV